MNSFNNYKAIKEEVYKLQRNCNLIVVTKNQSIETIMSIINSGHLHFGENKVQEAKEKWNSFPIDKKKDVKLHMIGKLQSNKAKDAFSLFDFIHTLDSDKLAKIFAGLESDSQRNIKYFIQINIGNEMQKNGINSSLVKEFTNYCRNDLKLNIIGLMCIPPVGIHPSSFFQKMQELKVTNNLNELSMGMSSDYKEALHHGSTYLRIGSAIFK